MEQFYIGIDGGGSKTHAILCDSKHQIIDQAVAGSANIATSIEVSYKSITEVIEKLLTKNQLSVKQVAIGIGVAGFRAKQELFVLKSRLLEQYPSVTIESDCHIACLAAHQKKNGAIIICGTGVVAYVQKNGVYSQIGGWGFPHGDLGGGAWIGLEICRLLCQAIDNVIPWSLLLDTVYSSFERDFSRYKQYLATATPTTFADLAKSMADLLGYDPLADLLLSNAVSEVNKYLLRVQNYEVPIKICGGLAKLYLPYLRKYLPELELFDGVLALGGVYLLR